MKKLIILFILFFSLTLFQSETFSRQSDLAKIRKEIDKINQLVFKKIKVIGDTEEWLIYVDNKNRIRKLIYSLNHPATEGGATSIEYFSTKGKLIYLAFEDTPEFYYKEDPNKFSGNAYFVKGKILKIDSLMKNKNIKGILPPKYGTKKDQSQRDIEFYYSTVTSVKKAFKLPKRFPFRKKEVYIERMGGYVNGLIFYAGRYRFRPLKAGEQTFINAHNVILRSKPTTKSKILGKLNALDPVGILSVGKQQRIGYWAKHHWYQLQAGKKEGWVFGAFLEPLEVKLK